MDKDFHVENKFCPSCGSPDRFCEQLGDEAREKGQARKEWSMSYDVRQGAAIDQARTILLAVGASVPGYQIKTDVCMSCGTVYATEIKRIDAHLETRPVQQRKLR